MKQLIAAVVLLIALGIAGFFYRNALEHPTTIAPEPVACTQEAKVCPDGSSVGRTGSSCEFTPCAPPNYEDTGLQLAFVVPAGYVANPGARGQDETLRAVFDHPAKGEVPHSIVIRSFLVGAGKTATTTIIANTTYEPSGNEAKALSEFKKKTLGMHTYYCATIERFEGQVHTSCYLPRTTDVLRFEVLEKDVDWMNPNLDIDALPEHKAFYQLLSIVQA